MRDDVPIHSHLRLIAAFLWETFRHPLQDSLVDVRTGQVVARGPDLSREAL